MSKRFRFETEIIRYFKFMTRDIQRFGTNELKIIVLIHDAITRVDLDEYKKLRKNST